MKDEFPYPDMLDIEIAEENGQGGIGLGSVIGIQSILQSDNPLREFKKALSAGYGLEPATKTDGGSFRLESLEPTLKNLTFTDESTALFNDLLKSKKTAESTVEEYSTIDEIGEAFTFEEGGLPASEDDAYSRKYELIKYVGTVGSVTNPMMQVRALVAPMQREIKSKMLAIKRKANQICYDGNKSFVSTEWDGLYHAVLKAGLTDNVKDLTGHRPLLEDFNDAIAVLEDQKGYTTDPRAYISPQAKKNYKNELLKDKRYLVGGELKSEVEGIKANKIVHDGGDMPMRKDIFLNPKKYPRLNKAGTTFVATGSTPPNTPTITSITPTADANSSVPAGTYDYAVVAVNKFGHKSAPAELGDIVIADGENAKFVLADNGSASGQEATAFLIYRRAGGSTLKKDYQYIVTVGAADVSIVDDGSYLPGTGMIFVVDFDPEEVLAYHQLLDATKFPLGSVADSLKWIQRLYGALIVYNPKRIFILKNVGSIPNA